MSTLTLDQCKEIVRRRVMRGAIFLDKQEPDWWKRLDVETLKLQSCNRCVLGQLYGSFDAGVDIALGLNWLNPCIRNGFDASCHDRLDELNNSTESNEPQFDEMTKCWLNEISVRQQSACNARAAKIANDVVEVATADAVFANYST